MSTGPSSTFADTTQTHSVRGVFARTRGGVKLLSTLTERMERIANRAVRPVVVGRKVA